MSASNFKFIRKRDNTLLPFDQSKITNAIWKAAQSVGGTDSRVAMQISSRVVEYLNERFTDKDIPAVEDIQDAVEKVLIEDGHAKTAKAFILYRQKHKEIRDVKDLFDDLSLVENYIGEKDWRVKENSNMTYSLQGLNFNISSAIVARYWLQKVYNKKIADAHREGDFHVHDLGILGPYCVGWDLQDLLMSGFGGVRGKVESKPPKHLPSALGQLVNFFFTLQGEAAGAQAFSNFDTYLAPFIRQDNMSYDQVKQAMQAFVFNINVPTRVGFQTPFTNITLDLKVPDFIKNDPVIMGGKPTKDNYGDFEDEMRMFNKAFAEVMIEGDAKGRIFTFPIPTYNITKDFDWDNEDYNKIWEMTAKYGIPYYSNFVNSDMSPEDARSMCCRLRLDNRELRKRGGGLFGANPLTGSVGVVTLNMPRLGYLSKNENEFFERIDMLMDIARESLQVKRNILEKFTEQGLYPYSAFFLRKIKESEGVYWKNHFSTIGLVGMNEALQNMFDISISEPEGIKFAVKTMNHMRDKLQEYQEDDSVMYNLEATPAEGTSYRLAMLDKRKFPGLRVANETTYMDKNASPYYTNSTQLPVGFTDDIFEALEKQDQLQTLYTGGTVLHGFVGEKLPSAEATKKLVRKIAETYNLPYYTLTPTFSICPKHGYLEGEHEYCPKCDALLAKNQSNAKAEVK
ncbi:MAG: ribonucleoside triphosphate reductase [Candidatus Diapherotrites archaeon]